MIKHNIKDNITVILDEEDIDLTQETWGYNKKQGVTKVVKANKKQEMIIMHHLIMERIIKRKLHPREIVTHHNKNKLDNRRENLLIVDHSKAIIRSKTYSNNKSGYRGVNFDKNSGLWRASIGYRGKKKYLGYYTSPKEGAIAYNKAARELFGEFAPQNKIE